MLAWGEEISREVIAPARGHVHGTELGCFGRVAGDYGAPAVWERSPSEPPCIPPGSSAVKPHRDEAFVDVPAEDVHVPPPRQGLRTFAARNNATLGLTMVGGGGDIWVAPDGDNGRRFKQLQLRSGRVSYMTMDVLHGVDDPGTWEEGAEGQRRWRGAGGAMSAAAATTEDGGAREADGLIAEGGEGEASGGSQCRKRRRGGGDAAASAAAKTADRGARKSKVRKSIVWFTHLTGAEAAHDLDNEPGAETEGEEEEESPNSKVEGYFWSPK
jgi:hypothetical protein